MDVINVKQKQKMKKKGSVVEDEEEKKTLVQMDVVVVAETESRCPIHETAPNGWEMSRTRAYGRTSVGFFVRCELP